jgi:hypothetical protein
MFVVFIKFVVSWFSGWFMFGKPEPEESIYENTAEEAMEIATKREDENERKRNQKSKNKSGGIVDTNTKEESDRKKEIKYLAEIARKKNENDIKEEEEFLSSERHRLKLEELERVNNKPKDKHKEKKKPSIYDAVKRIT